MTSYNDLSVHELLDICYSIVINLQRQRVEMEQSRLVDSKIYKFN